MESYFWIPAVIWPLIAGAKAIYDTRGACFAGPDVTTDNEKMLTAAGKVRFFDWPSRMHQVKNCRAETREYWVLSLKIVQMFFRGRGKTSEHVNFSLALAANAVSGVTLFFVARHYFGAETGLFVAFLYSTLLWAYQILLVIGHVHLAQMWFLIAIRCLQMAEITDEWWRLGWYAAAGILTAVSFGSSSASRKFPPLSFVAFVYSLHAFMVLPWTRAFYDERSLILLVVVAAAVLGRLLVKIFHVQIGRLLDKAIGRGKEGQVLDQIAHAGMKFVIGVSMILALFPHPLEVLPFFGAYAAGLFLVAAHLLLPLSTFMENVQRYRAWLVSTWRSHFHAYPDQVATFGRKLPDGFRGAGLPWLPRLFWRVARVPFLLYVAGLCVLVGYAGGTDAFAHPLLGLVYVGVIVVVSLLPVIISEMGHSLQVGKAYFPSFIGLLILIALGFHRALELSRGRPEIHMAVIGAACAALAWQWGTSLYGYFADVMPARMGATHLYRALRKRGITEFDTYGNTFNDCFVHTMLCTYPGEFKVNFVDSMADMKSGWFVVPPTSAKSETMESQQFSILNGDFRADPVLNLLLDDRAIEKIAAGKFQTRGTSRYFSLETEVTGFRDLILHQMKEKDYWLGNGWLVSAEAVRQASTSRK